MTEFDIRMLLFTVCSMAILYVSVHLALWRIYSTIIKMYKILSGLTPNQILNNGNNASNVNNQENRKTHELF